MLKVIKRKAKEQAAVNPRIDMSLVLSEQKMSWNDFRAGGLFLSSELPASVTVADEDHPVHDSIRPLSRPMLPSAFAGAQSLVSTDTIERMIRTFGKE